MTRWFPADPPFSVWDVIWTDDGRKSNSRLQVLSTVLAMRRKENYVKKQTNKKRVLCRERSVERQWQATQRSGTVLLARSRPFSNWRIRQVSLSLSWLEGIAWATLFLFFFVSSVWSLHASTPSSKNTTSKTETCKPQADIVVTNDSGVCRWNNKIKRSEEECWVENKKKMEGVNYRLHFKMIEAHTHTKKKHFNAQRAFAICVALGAALRVGSNFIPNRSLTGK